MEYGVKELAQLAGVTGRTLRWYDARGLLRPLRTTQAGYRVYGPEQVDRLQEILFYRELGLELEAIGRLLDDPAFRREVALQSHLAELERRRERLDRLILTVKKTMLNESGEAKMSDQEKFEGFKQGAIADNERKFGDEIRQKYGEGSVDKSNEQFAGLTREEYGAMEALGQEILTRLAAAVTAGDEPKGTAGQSIAALHRRWLGYTWASYSAEAHKGLCRMYLEDERFTKYYDEQVAGCAAFLRDAVEAL